MRRNAPEAELRRSIGKACGCHHGICIRWVPVNGKVHVIKKTGTNHIDLAAAAFLGRCSIKADLARRSGFFQPGFDRDGGARRTRTKQMVPAGLTRALTRNRRKARQGRLTEPRKRIKLAENCDHWAVALLPACDKGGRDVRNAAFHIETFRLQRGRKEV